jgi:hypothetical protein
MMMTPSISTRLASLGFAAVITVAILAGLDTLATTGQSAQALLAQQGTLQVSCVADGRKG